ncbi:MAG: ComEC/Rec2 family competence protein [Verrucomicrobia bacterium]|nr:ComEC/Rec2 family competence protein [Verrucomicrobiota bacterium]
MIPLFWRKNPALFLGLSLLLGTASALSFHILFPLFLIALCLSSPNRRSLATALLSFIAAFTLTTYRCPHVSLPEEKLSGKGIFHIDEVKKSSSFFNRSLLYKGTLTDFQTPDGTIYPALPCALFLPLKNPPDANCAYKISGTLSQKRPHTFSLKPDKKIPWEKVPNTFSIAKWRFNAKKALSTYLARHIHTPSSRAFLTALATAEVDEKLLSLELSRLGLQHILAISGFHFALIALFLHFLLRLFLPYKLSYVALIAALTLYYLFLGNAPSIQRAYLAICILSLGHILNLRTSGLNALGASLIIELLYNPLVAIELSFQLSFLCTCSILLLYAPMHEILTKIFPIRTRLERSQMLPLDRCGYFASNLLRKTLAANLAVHLLTLPVLLHLFHHFPVLSLAYNLFFPACASITLFLLSASFLFAPLYPLSHLLHALNDKWTSALLHITSNPPACLDYSIRSRSLSLTYVLLILAVSFYLAARYHEKKAVAI